MTVSILVPFYQVAPFIERCARSVLGQTYPDIEYLFIDDHSTDDGPDILRKTLEDYPDRKDAVRIIRNERNLGLASSRNLAVRECRTDFLLWVDADDWISPDAVEKLIARQAQDDADIVSGKVLKVYNGNTKPFPIVSPSSKTDTIIGFLDHSIAWCIWGRLIRKTLYSDNGVQCLEGINYNEDYQVIPRLFYFAEKVADIPSVIYYYGTGNPASYTSLSDTDIRIRIQRWFQNLASNRMLRDFFFTRLPAARDIIEKNIVYYLKHILRDTTRAGDKTSFLKAVQELKRCDRKYVCPDTLRLWYAARVSPSVCWMVKRFCCRLSDPLFSQP